MNPTNWLTHTTDPVLQQAAREKIAQLQSVENDIPAVIIVHNLVDRSIVYMCKRGCDILRTSLAEIRLSHEDYHGRYFNPEDVPNYGPKVLALLERNDDNEIATFFQQVRPSPAEPWRWYASSMKVLLRDAGGKPMLGIALALPIDENHFLTPKIERLVQENTFLRKNQALFASLSKREKEVLRLLAGGHSSAEIAATLYLSEETVKTHRRNIRAKLGAESVYDLLQFAQAFNLV